MRLKLFLFFCCLVSIPVYSQTYYISGGISYGTYDQSDLKNFQKELYSDAVDVLGVPFKITDEFPGYYGLQINANLINKKIVYGLQINLRSTAGRTAYSDYSGYYNIDSYLNGYEILSQVGTEVDNLKSIDFLLKAKLGVGFSNYLLESNFKITDSPIQQDNISFNSTNLILGAESKLRVRLFKAFYSELNLGYDLNMLGKLKYSSNSKYHLINNANNEVLTNWSGIRIGIGFGVKI